MFAAPRRCDGIARREVIRIGCLSAFGLTLPSWMRLRAGESHSPRPKSCILLWLDGGPSHLETFDPKPDAPAEVRGPFGNISTAIPGVAFGELVPHTARIADKIAVIRSMTSPLGEHGLANHYLMTGYKPSPVLEYPSYGAVVAGTRGGGTALPPYVTIPDGGPATGPGFLGPVGRPFATGGDPAKPDFRVQDLDFYPGVTAERTERRREFLRQIDRVQRSIEANPPDDVITEQAYRLVLSPTAKRAFDLADEKPATRARYGPRTFGQSCLLARRLIERGVGFVTVNYSGWDTHADLVLRLKDGYAGAKIGVGLVPTFDQTFAALIADLSERGLLDQTLVVAMGEFGRTPKVNVQGGRDHWPRAFSVVLAGGGVKGGQVVGATDRIGESPADRPVTPADLARTLYTLLGVNPNQELQTADGRPVLINQGGHVIEELLA